MIFIFYEMNSRKPTVKLTLCGVILRLELITL